MTAKTVVPLEGPGFCPECCAEIRALQAGFLTLQEPAVLNVIIFREIQIAGLEWRYLGNVQGTAIFLGSAAQL